MPDTKVRRKFEAQFTAKLQRWLKVFAKDMSGSSSNFGPIEVKVSYDKRFNLKQNIKEHQLNNLLAIRRGRTLVYKISDMDRTRKPWDLGCYTNSIPVFIIMWFRLRNKTFYILDPYWIESLMKSGQASITEEDAAANCRNICHLR